MGEIVSNIRQWSSSVSATNGSGTYCTHTSGIKFNTVLTLYTRLFLAQFISEEVDHDFTECRLN